MLFGKPTPIYYDRPSLEIDFSESDVRLVIVFI